MYGGKARIGIKDAEHGVGESIALSLENPAAVPKPLPGSGFAAGQGEPEDPNGRNCRT
jgi:hypothetical protein